MKGLESGLDDQIPNVYLKLKELATLKLTNERINLTLTATDLVHEVYEKLSGERKLHFKSVTHFIAICSMHMRRILVDYARKRAAEKRGGDLKRVTLDHAVQHFVADWITILDVNKALSKLEQTDPQLAKIVEYRFFAGMDYDSISRVLEVSVTTVKRRWALAKARLKQLLTDEAR